MNAQVHESHADREASTRGEISMLLQTRVGEDFSMSPRPSAYAPSGPGLAAGTLRTIVSRQLGV